MRLPILGLVLAAMLVPSISVVRAQVLPNAKSLAPTPTIKAAQQTQSYLGTRARLSSAAKQALMMETAREKAGDCKDAGATYDAVTCLRKQEQLTTANYEAMTKNLRALLALADAAASPAMVGPTGKPPTPAQQAAEYDRLQQTWDVYRKTVESAAYDQFKGGTEAPISNALADLMVVRSHMKELAFLYDFILGNH